MKVLIIVPSHPVYSGVDFHRLVVPHNVMGVLYPECEISMINEIDSATEEFLKCFDLVIANRFISKVGDYIELIQKLKRVNVPYVIDLDDDYKLNDTHILQGVSKGDGHAAKIIYGINHAIGVTTTHTYLGRTLQNETLVKKIRIVENGILPVGQFETKDKKLDVPTFGWSGSITHFEDVMELFDSLLSMYKDNSLKFKVVYGGFSPDDDMARAIAGVLSCKGVAPADKFATFPSTTVDKYANFYDHIDISLIPLRDNRFNNMKSNLKLIEAGFKKKAVICSNVYPYSPMLKHGINCLVVNSRHDWYRNMVKLIKNPNMIKDLAEQLYIDVQCQHMNVVAEARYNAYKSFLNI
ncbi:MAG: hypothetical protein WCP61_08770 [Chitinophagia bacterium]